MNISSPHLTHAGHDPHDHNIQIIHVDVTQPAHVLRLDFLTTCETLANGAKARFLWTLDGTVIDGFNPQTNEPVGDTWVQVHRDDPHFWITDLSNHKDRDPAQAWDWFCDYMTHWNPGLAKWDGQ